MPIKQAAPRQHHFMQITSQQIEEIRAGKIKTFEILFNAYYPRVKSFAFGMIKDQYEAEEIAQNVFLKLWSNREKLSSDNTLSSYIFTIVQNEVYDFFREKHYSLGYQEKMLSTPQNLQYEIDSEYNIKEIKSIVNRTLQNMPPQRRTIYQMSREQFLSNDEIAKTLGLSKRTVEIYRNLMPIKQAAPRQHHFMQITSQQIEEIRAGKIKTFEILFNAYYPRVKSFAFGMIKDQYEAEEIAQNVFLKLWSNREKLSSDNTLSSYIFTIVQNEVYDFFREKHYSLGYQEKMLSTPQNLQYEIDSEYNIKEIKSIVNRTLQNMPPQRRTIYQMSREQFLSNDEIAKTLGLSKRTVEKHISLALATIKKNLGDFLFWLFIFFIK